MFLLILKVPLGVLISAMLAFALAKLRLRFGAAIMFAVFLGLTIPIYITIVPVFVLLRNIGAVDSVPGLVGPYLAFGIPFEVLVLQSVSAARRAHRGSQNRWRRPWRIFFTHPPLFHPGHVLT
jgi:raffinose/stachyose/melibiose transport system permease protein